MLITLIPADRLIPFRKVSGDEYELDDIVANGLMPIQAGELKAKAFIGIRATTSKIKYNSSIEDQRGVMLNSFIISWCI